MGTVAAQATVVASATCPEFGDKLGARVCKKTTVPTGDLVIPAQPPQRS
jgi:hypothetical protein